MHTVSTDYKKLTANLLEYLIKYSFHLLLLVFTLLFSKIIQIEYKVRDFKYLLIILLYFIGIFFYWMYRNVLAKRLYRILFSMLPALIVIILLFYKPEYLFAQVRLFVTYIKIINVSFYNSTATYFYYFTALFTITVPIITASLLYLEKKGLGNILIIISLVYIYSLWFAAELFEIKNYILVYMILCSFNFCMEKLKNTSKNYIRKGVRVSLNRKRITSYFLVVSVVTSMLSFSSVNKFGTKSIFVSVNEKLAKSKRLMEKSKNNRYDIASSGYFSSSQKLGGPIKLSRDRVFKVKSDGLYYLKGTVKDYYDGFTWNRISSDYKKQEDEPLTSMSLGFNRYLEGNIGETAAENINKPSAQTMTIYPDTLHNSSIFAPSFTYNIKLQYGYIGYDDAGSYMILGRTGIQAPYTINFYKSKSGIELFNKAYESKIPIDYAANNGEDIWFTEKYSKYLQLPDNLSPRIYDLVKEITKGCSNASEKAKRIQDYLSKNYSYTLEVSEVPENKEFVDYFLFSEKKGYCTYFATAATIMYRIAGIPARYVEGFAMSNTKNEEGLYEVTHEMAHAWTEILVSSKADIWSIVDCVPYAEREQYIKQYTSTIMNEQTGIIRNSDSAETNNSLNENLANNSSYKKYTEKIIVCLIALISVFSGLTIIYIIVKTITLGIKKYKVIKSVSSVPLYYFAKARLRYLCKDNRIDEDDYIWLEQIEDETIKGCLRSLIDYAYGEFYGKKDDMVLNKKQMYRNIETYLKLKQGVLRYYYYKIFKAISTK